MSVATCAIASLVEHARPRPGASGRRRQPSASTPTGSASMKSRRSGVQPGGSYGSSTNGPPPTPQTTCRLASRPMPLVQVCGVKRRLRCSSSSASVRRPRHPEREHARRAGRRRARRARGRRSSSSKVRGHLAAGDLHAGLLAQRPHAGEVGARQRLLDPQHRRARRAARRRAAPPAASSAGSDVAGHPPPLVEVDEDRPVVADGLADRRARTATPSSSRSRAIAELQRAEAQLAQLPARRSARCCGRAQLAERRVRRQAVGRAAEQRRARARRAPGRRCPTARPPAASSARRGTRRSRARARGGRSGAGPRRRTGARTARSRPSCRRWPTPTRPSSVCDADERRVEARARHRVPRGAERRVERRARAARC